MKKFLLLILSIFLTSCMELEVIHPSVSIEPVACYSRGGIINTDLIVYNNTNDIITSLYVVARICNISDSYPPICRVLKDRTYHFIPPYSSVPIRIIFDNYPFLDFDDFAMYDIEIIYSTVETR